MIKAKFFLLRYRMRKELFNCMFSKDDICPGEDKTLFDKVIKHLIDLGDIIGVTGFVFITRTGEISVHAQTFTLLAKSLKPLPVVKRDEAGQCV